MPGRKSTHTAKEDRKAKKGVSKDEAERRAWATVNKQSSRKHGS